MANVYKIGKTVKMTAVFRNAARQVADPTTVTLIVKKPDGTETTYTYALGTVTKESTGVYSKSITTDAEGTWQYYFQGTGAVPDADRDYFQVVGKFS